jgi:glyoxylase-like metal-dependent hydrolase (beta-lactamase superfamily II)
MTMKAQTKPLTDVLPGGGPAGCTVAVEPYRGAEAKSPPAGLESTGGQGRIAQARALGIGVPRSKWKWIPFPAFVIEHPTAGPVLVDTALHPSVSAKPAANLGRFFASATSYRMPDGDLPTQLRARGIDPKSIKTVILTHLHFDHTSGIAEFPNATFVLAAREWEAATTVSRPAVHGYRRAHFDYLFDYRTLDFDGPLIDSYATFGRTFDLFGDGSIRLAFTPGHTLGHMSVIAHLASRDFVIAGDAVYTEAQLRGENEPARPEDLHQWQRSQRELRRFAERFPNAVVVPGHDAAYWETLKRRYE